MPLPWMASSWYWHLKPLPPYNLVPPPPPPQVRPRPGLLLPEALDSLLLLLLCRTQQTHLLDTLLSNTTTDHHDMAVAAVPEEPATSPPHLLPSPVQPGGSSGMPVGGPEVADDPATLLSLSPCRAVLDVVVPILEEAGCWHALALLRAARGQAEQVGGWVMRVHSYALVVTGCQAVAMVVPSRCPVSSSWGFVWLEGCPSCFVVVGWLVVGGVSLVFCCGCMLEGMFFVGPSLLVLPRLYCYCRG